MVNYRLNEQKNGVEILFNEKPDAATLDALKAAGFRWNRGGGYWYALQSAERVALAAALAGGAECAPAVDAGKGAAAAPAPAVDREMLRQEYAKIWGNSQKMIRWSVDQVAEVAEVSGGFIPIEKQKIKTRFCFGERGYDYEEAQDLAENARTSCEHLKRENMKAFDEKIEHLEEQAEDIRRPWYVALVQDRPYYSEPDGCKVRGLHYAKLSEVIEACGGSCDLAELPGKHIYIDGVQAHCPESWEMKNIIEAYKRARAAHEKKVNAYIKRYGTSKVDAWTYWIDA